MKRIAALSVLVGLLVLVPSGSALAQGSSTCQAYSSVCSVDALTVARTPNQMVPDAQSTGSSLPFTGLDVGLLAIGGVVLLGGGLAVRLMSRRLN